MKYSLIILTLLVFNFLTGFTKLVNFSYAQVHEEASSPNWSIDNKGNYKPSFFPVGVYIYGNEEELTSLASKRNLSYEQWLEETFKDLKRHNCNSVYIANLSNNPKGFRKAVLSAERNNLYVFAQLTASMYLRPSLGIDHYKNVTLKAVEKFIPQYHDLPAIVAWMPKEEPSTSEVPLLANYRKYIKQLDKNRAIFTLHNTAEPFEKDIENLPEWFGFDRYRFKTMIGKYGMLVSTPKDMVSRLCSELDLFYSLASQRRRPLIYVMQGFATDWLGTKEQLLKFTKGKLPTKRSGWVQIENDLWFGWTKYPVPKFGMRLQCWLGVLEGAKGLLVYRYNPQGEDIGKRKVALIGHDGSETQQWKEFGETIAVLNPLFPLFLSWTKEASYVIQSNNPDVLVSSFVDKISNQRYVVIVNSKIAEWDNNSPALVGSNTELHFDFHGLQGLREAGDLKARFTIISGYYIKDLITNQIVEVDKENSFELSLPPGGGRVLQIHN
jgi:hypothetical protein